MSDQWHHKTRGLRWLTTLCIGMVALLSPVLNIPAQSAPTISTQPVSQTNLVGSNVSFSVEVSGVGPFTYQWQFNGTNLPNNIISTVAGIGNGISPGSFSGDGGLATGANLFFPQSVAVDAAGNVYIADTLNWRIRKVDTNGIITTVAGNGNSGGNLGDGGPATNASLNGVYGLVMDAIGNLFITDSNNNRVRKVDTNGIINTVAGGGSGGDGGAATNASLNHPDSVAVDASGDLYIADDGDSLVRKVDPNGIITTVAGGGDGGDGGAATNASLNGPYGVTLDTVGNLYISDSGNDRIRKVDTNGVITTVAGTGSQGYSGDGGAATNATFRSLAGVAMDALGNLYVADSVNHRIRKVDANGIISTVVGYSLGGFNGDGGTLTNTSLGSPQGIAVDTSGNLYIADTGNNRVRKALLDAGNSSLIISPLSAYSVGGYSVVVSSSYGSVTSAVATLTVQTAPIITVQPASQYAVIGSSPVFPVTVAGSGPFGYSWFLAGTNLVQSGTNSALMLNGISTNNFSDYTVVVTNSYGSVTSQVASLMMAIPPSVTVSGSQTVYGGTNTILIATASGTGPLFYQWQLNGTNLPRTITVVAGGGTFGVLGDGGPATNGFLYGPNAATLDAFGNMFIADWANNRVREVMTNGIITTVAGNGSTGKSVSGSVATNTGVFNPAFVVPNPADNFFVVDNGSSVVARVGPNGILTNFAGISGIAGFRGDFGLATNALLFNPFGAALDSSGNLFIADTGNNRIRKVGKDGIITTVAGTGSLGYSGDGGLATSAKLNAPWDVYVDNQGNLFISDTGNNRIRKVGPYGNITTVAGGGSGGDGGAATNASLYHPDTVAFDSRGNMYIADAYNRLIRQIDTNGVITTIAGGGANYLPVNGMPATSVVLFDPSCVAVDKDGNIIVDDNEFDLILKLVSGPNLMLNNVSLNNAGTYTLVVTSPYASVTSSSIVLTVVVPPNNLAASFVNGFGVQLQFDGTPNYPYTLQSTTNLTPPVNWQPVITNSTDASGNWMFVDTNTLSAPFRFYRSMAQ